VPTEVPDLAAALERDWKGPGRPSVIARKPHFSYYADAAPIPFAPLDSLEQLARYAHETGANYLFVAWPEALLRPPFAFLLVPEFAPPGLELVAQGAQGHSVLYRVTPEFGTRMPAWYPREWLWRAGEGMTRIAPNDPEAWLAAGEGRHARRDFDGARVAYEVALRLRPRWGRALMDLGNLDSDTGDFAGRAAITSRPRRRACVRLRSTGTSASPTFGWATSPRRARGSSATWRRPATRRSRRCSRRVRQEAQ
jgi:hypothetical protein